MGAISFSFTFPMSAQIIAADNGRLGPCSETGDTAPKRSLGMALLNVLSISCNKALFQFQ